MSTPDPSVATPFVDPRWLWVVRIATLVSGALLLLVLASPQPVVEPCLSDISSAWTLQDLPDVTPVFLLAYPVILWGLRVKSTKSGLALAVAWTEAKRATARRW